MLVNRWYPDGGVEHFIEQLVAETGADIDYVVASLITEVESKVDCEKIGAVIPSRNIAKIYTSGREITQTIRRTNCDTIHIQASNGSAFYLAHLAKKAGITKRIVHSHNAGAEASSSPLKKFIGDVSTGLYVKSATDLWACSANAGEYLFGARAFKVFLNGIDIDKFAFCASGRTRLRDELDIAPEVFLLGSIGRIAYQKNPVFQLRVFAELRKIIPSAKFCMVGSGDMEAEVKAEAETLKLGDSLIRIARTSDPATFYSAFDALVFPSIFEGLPFVGIEGQCSGLPIYGSEALPRELAITDRIFFYPIDEEPSVWAARIAAHAASFPVSGRDACADALRAGGFDRRECFVRIAGAYGGDHR